MADALTKHLGKSSLSSHTQSVRFGIRDRRHTLMPVCDSADKAEISAAVVFESEERLCQVALANCFVRVKGLDQNMARRREQPGNLTCVASSASA